ncbi:hypothetical protein [Mycolicibacterium houstonense]|uniref:hypothetical protein n=1 Tax=Mycolicibacterium houstonense TaxID=146021 RepID=UPI0008357226|nr:hypothetical protein [Mycolicibacterium houstonense]
MSVILDVALAVSGPVGVALGAFGQRMATRRLDRAVANKSDADAAQAFAVAAVTLVKPLEERVSKLEAQHSLAIAYIRDLWSWIDRHMPGRKPPAPPEALNLT